MFGEPFRITETAEGEGVVRLAVAGELDIATRGALEQRLLELSTRRTLVRLDLSRLEFIDASGVGVLIGAIETSNQPWRLEVEDDLAPHVSRLLAAFGLEFG